MTNEGTIWRKAREKSEMSQQDVAEKLGFTSSQYVSNIERGLTTMAKKHYRKLARIFGPKVVNEVIEFRGERLKQALRNCL